MLPAAVERWRPLAAQAAAAAGAAFGVVVPVDLVLAHVYVESRGNTLAKRKEKDGEYSRGLMQVKEATARALGLATPEQLLVPSVGITYGTRYLAKQLKRYGGNPAVAAAAYNAGTAKYKADETFINQTYVNDVLHAFALAGGGTSAAATPANQPGGIERWIVPAGIGLLLFAAVAASARPRAAA